MTLFTLTTDLGIRDHYVSAVKGYIHSRVKDASIVDVTHLIKPFNIAQAAFVLKNAYKNFPENTIHLINVETNIESNDEYICVYYQKQYFFAKNNGLISIITDGEADQVILLKTATNEERLFPLRSILANAACQLSEHFKIDKIGEPLQEMKRITAVKPLIEQDIIRGMILYIDNYGNAITNIRRSHFQRYGENRKFNFYFSRKESADRIYEHYSDVPEGEIVCLFNSCDLLEIAINNSNASQLLSIQEQNKVLIEFE
jgi:S-adenosylmethionine hydrolase